MGDAIISRRGATIIERTISPNINFVSKTSSEIVVTFTNNDLAEAEIYYGLTAPLTDTVTLATTVTSSNITFSGLDPSTQYTISAYAIVTNATLKKIKSEIVSTQITTDAPIYTAATGGTTAEYDSNGARFKSHTFTNNGTFEVTTVGDNVDDRNKVDYLIIAGGGGSNVSNSGGGGAGGYRTTNGTSGENSSAESKVTVTATTYAVTIGAGGANANGNNSSVAFAATITSTGGGRGNVLANGNAGGSGGGAGNSNVGTVRTGGAGTTNQGFAGGNTVGASFNGASGGGGAGQVGTNGNTSHPGKKGGDGLANTLRDGTSETRGGGGGGGGYFNTGGAGGAGGGGNGTDTSGTSPGTANTGGGAGGAGANNQTSQTGGSGIVIIRYEIAPSV